MRLIKILCFVLFVAVGSGCSTYNLRQAQDSYVDAVKSEQALALESGVSALAQYKITLAMVDEVIRGKQKRSGTGWFAGCGIHTEGALRCSRLRISRRINSLMAKRPAQRVPWFQKQGTSRQELLLFLRSVLSREW